MEQLAMTQHPFVKRDKYGREILERKVICYFRDDEIQLWTSLKKAVQYDIKVGDKIEKKTQEEFTSVDQDDLPYGWHRRRDNNYFYNPNNVNLINIIRFKIENNDWVKFADSFCIFFNRKTKEATEQGEAFEKISGLTLKDIDKVRALPDLYEKSVPDMAHQKIASRYGYYLPDWAMFLEQGLGKTKIALETFRAKQELGLVDRCLVIGPLSVVNNKGWGKQIKEYGRDASYVFIKGTKEQKLEILDDEHGVYDFYLINYEGLLTIEDEILSWVDDRTMVILDESSKIKNFYAARTKVCLQIGKLAKHKGILTGTPVTQNAYDIFSQFYFLDCGDSFGQSYDSFLRRYFNAVGFKKIAKRGALEEIAEIASRKSIRFTKEEALPDLPPKTYQVREVEMHPNQRRYYDAILRQEMIRLSEMENVTAQNILVTILRLQQIADGYVSPKDSNEVKLAPRELDCPNPKLNELGELLDELGDKPIVIWTRFRHVIDTIAKLLREKEITYVAYVGGMTDKEREDSEAKFQSGFAQVFLSLPQAGGMGMNLQRASYSIYFDNDYSLQNRLQSEDRIHRIGQKGNCTIIDIVCANSIDLKVLDVLLEKKQIADVVTGDWKKFISEAI